MSRRCELCRHHSIVFTVILGNKYLCRPNPCGAVAATSAAEHPPAHDLLVQAPDPEASGVGSNTRSLGTIAGAGAATTAGGTAKTRRRCAPSRSASATMVSVGGAAPPVGKVELPAMNRL